VLPRLDLVRAQQCFIQVFSSGNAKMISGVGGKKAQSPPQLDKTLELST